ncbi:MAG: hypothetical protein ACXW3O_09765 [Brevundimonas sp.]
MLRLRATLVAMTAARPWRAGWSMERGVDFVLAVAAAPTPLTPAGPERMSPAEPPSFLEADAGAPPGATVVRTFVSLAAAAAALPEPIARSPFRAWSRLPAGPSRA